MRIPTRFQVHCNAFPSELQRVLARVKCRQKNHHFTTALQEEEPSAFFGGHRSRYGVKLARGTNTLQIVIMQHAYVNAPGNQSNTSLLLPLSTGKHHMEQGRVANHTWKLRLVAKTKVVEIAGVGHLRCWR
jgi:hypothetical protein